MLGYDCLRILRSVWKHKRGMIDLEDILFGMGSGIFLFVHYFRDNNGILRAYLLAAVILGILAWKCSLSPYFVGGSSFLLEKCRKILGIPVRKVRIFVKWLKFWMTGVRIRLNTRMKRLIRRIGHNRGVKNEKEKKHRKKEKSGKKNRHAD